MLYVIDTETTGHHKDNEVPEIVELAILDPFNHPTTKSSPPNAIVERFNPTKAMAWGAIGTHHILPEELKNCRPSEKAKELFPADAKYIVGHNVDYDWKALGSPDVKRICTLAISRRLWPEIDHTLSAMIYFIHQDDMRSARNALKNAHSAEADCHFSWKILNYAMNKEGKTWEDGIEKIWEWAEQCRIPTHWSFGKFKGHPIKAADRGYLQWCLRQPDFDPYVIIAVKQALGVSTAQS